MAFSNAGRGLTRRCSGLATLAAELHFVRPARLLTLRFMRSILSLALVLLASIASAQPSALTVGVSLAADVIPGAYFTNHSDLPAPDLFVRTQVMEDLEAELRAGYRGYSYSEFHGSHSSSYVLRQYPVTLGLYYVFPSSSSLHLLLSMGAGVSFSSWSSSQYLYPGPKKEASGTRTVFTWTGGVGALLYAGRHAVIECGGLYYSNPITSDTGEPHSQDYIRFRVAAGYRF